MKVVNVAILGQVRSGRDIHGRYLITAKDKYKIVAVCDALQERREKASKEYNCDVYDNYKEMLKRKDIDLFINALPSHLHVPVTKEILKAGFNVLCEKPLARKVKEVDMLIETAEKSGKVLAIFQQSRMHHIFSRLKRL